jgi:UDP-N-acetylmuramoyl-tripeptide--D-alanyl-D-alanine ligase
MTVDLTAALGAAGEPLRASGWSIDTRTLQPGDVFFAIPGTSHDGHDFVDEAARRGALACVLSREMPCPVRLYRVKDTIAALQQVAVYARARWPCEIVAVTGSAGKTSTKDTIAHLLASEFETGKTMGNLNNHLGVPLSLLRIPDGARAAVLEMGMNHAGEIRALARLARPRIGVVTNVGYAHIENFASIEGIALAKRELIEELPADGVAVLNADDPRVRAFAAVHPGRSVFYGLAEDAAIRATDVELGSEKSRFTVDGVRFEIPLAGRHQVCNVLAAVAVGRLFGIALPRLAEAARGLRPAAMRGERFEHAGLTIWNDCYNSNPGSLQAMLEVLAGTPAARRIAVCGEMLELGGDAPALHREAGRLAAASGVDVLVAVAGMARELAAAAAAAGLRETFFFETPEEAGDFVRALARPGDALLFKGSRGVRMERALARVVGE